MFTSRRDRSLFQLFYPDFESQYRGLESLISPTDLKNVSVLDITYIKMDEETIFNWFGSIAQLCSIAIHLVPDLGYLLYISTRIILVTNIEIVAWMYYYHPCHIHG